MANRNRANKLVVPGSEQLMQQLKAEIAAELGFADYENMDKGDMPARIHGAIGGTITKRLIELGQQALANGANMNQSSLNTQEYRAEMVQDLQNGNGSITASQSGLQ